jgi:predicted helicase
MSTPASEIIHYLTEVDNLCRGGNAAEYSCRPALKSLFEKITTGLTITSEPKHIACGAPDYIITKGNIPLGCIKVKDINAEVNNKPNEEQFDCYKQSLGNLIITDYLTFQLFVEGEFAVSVTLANMSGNGIVPDKEQFNAFLELVKQFNGYSGRTICNSEQLAKMMADKAKLLAAIIRTVLKGKSEDDTLTGQYESFKKILIHNLDIAKFADIYAQTLACGLFAARLNQTDGQSFTRCLAPHLIPQSNPFLRKFFYYIAGTDLDSRITWIVDALADLFNCAAAEEIKKEFGRAGEDPYIHFYETFLAEYNPALRERRGVYYTPLPAVKFIVQAVDDILKTEFNLKDGFADHSKIKRVMPVKQGGAESVELHKVQILDPAAGTGTFLAEVIDRIYSYFEKNKGAWQDYCEKHLIPRLNGFEYLMAPYAMAHFKLGMKLKETGYTFKDESRLRVYLTNSLEETPKGTTGLFMGKWLAAEAEEAKGIKNDMPVMVIIGNPPCFSKSANITAEDFLAPYKKEPGSTEKLKERNPKWLNNDYVKFIRYGESHIEKYGDGVLAYINNHSFLDNPTFRGMRWNLLKTFDKIYILDLHGSSKKKETAPDGSKDKNVFDIQAGASINLFIKTGLKKEDELAAVYYYGLYGERETKYRFLLENTLSTINWKIIPLEEPQYFFTEKNFDNKVLYEEGFYANDLFIANSMGITTAHDGIFICDNIDMLLENIAEYFQIEPNMKNIKKIAYRPFDNRFIYYDTDRLERPRRKLMEHLQNEDNFSLCLIKVNRDYQYKVLITNLMTDKTVLSPHDNANIFPLYIYPFDNSNERTPNLNRNIVSSFSGKTGLSFTSEKQDNADTFAPIDLLDYIYTVLYSSKYRTKYREFLKIGFPRIPYPSDAAMFQKLAAIGSVLRDLHLLENVSPEIDLAGFPVTGTNEIKNINYKAEKIFINKQQYFENVPSGAWSYYIGGYQPAQKWLKDHKGRILSCEEIEHYQKIITVLKRTIEIQQQIDEVIENVWKGCKRETDGKGRV